MLINRINVYKIFVYNDKAVKNSRKQYLKKCVAFYGTNALNTERILD